MAAPPKQHSAVSMSSKSGNSGSNGPKSNSKIHPITTEAGHIRIPKDDHKIEHSTYQPTVHGSHHQDTKNFDSQIKRKELHSKGTKPIPPNTSPKPAKSNQPAKQSAPPPKVSIKPPPKALSKPPQKASLKPAPKASAPKPAAKAAAPTPPEPLLEPGGTDEKEAKKLSQPQPGVSNEVKRGSRTSAKMKAKKQSLLSKGAKKLSGSSRKKSIKSVKSSRSVKSRKGGKKSKSIGKNKRSKGKSQDVTKEDYVVQAVVQHQDETFTNEPHPFLLQGIAKAKTIHMTLTLGCQGEGHDLLIYNIYDQNKRRLCSAQENSKFKGGSRPFSLHFLNNDDKAVAYTITRENNLLLCCFGALCCGSFATITKGESGGIVGTVKQTATFGKLQYELVDTLGNVTFFMESPKRRFCLRTYVGSETTFQVYTQSISSNKKKLCADMRVYSSPKTFTDDPFVFTVQFSYPLSPESRIVVMGAGALVYLSFFENNPGCCDIYGNVCYLVLLIVLVLLLLFLFLAVRMLI